MFEDIFNVKDIDPEGKKFDRGESTSEVIFRCVHASIYRVNARAIFIVSAVASRELVDLADSAGTPTTRGTGATVHTLHTRTWRHGVNS